MAIGAQRLAVDPRLRDRVDHLVVGAAEHVRHHRDRGHLPQHHVIEADAVEAVLQRDHALDLVRLDHRGQDTSFILNGVWLRDSQSAVARMPPRLSEGDPIGREPGVVEIEPADHRAEVPGRLHRVELELGPGHLGAARRHGLQVDQPEQLVRQVFQRLEAAAQRVHQAVARGVVRLLAGDQELGRVIRDDVRTLSGFGRTLEMWEDIRAASAAA